MPDHDPTPKQLAAAIALHRQGKLAEAERLYALVLGEDPGNFDALHSLGLVNLQRGALAAGIGLLARASAVRPDSAEAWSNLALGYARSRRYDEAVASYDKAIALKPNHAAAHINRGNALLELRRFADALASYDKAIALKPGHAAAHNNRGAALKDLWRYDEALASFEQAIALNPGYAEAHCNRGAALRDLRRYDEALASYAKAIQLKPDYAEAHFNEGLCRLLLGQFEIGWRKYEWGWKRDKVARKRHADRPLWLGDESIAGKTLLIHADSGLGDAIQFCRYAPLLEARGAKVLLEVQPPLTSLMRSLNGVAAIIAQGEPAPGSDCQCPLFSLPLACKTTIDTIPNRVPYLAADPERVAFWRSELGGQGFKIGVASSGNPHNAQDHIRSIPLGSFAPLLNSSSRLFYLQKEYRPEEEAFLKARPEIRDLHHLDLAETAAVIACMDLVVSADTSIAHLAGALSKAVWILLAFAADWRWLMDREDSPWYPTARLFRQQSMGDWAGVMARVADALPAPR